jgi:CRISPR/Cas system-associated endonuclease Cas1
MPRITLANGVLDQASAASGPVEVCDADGRVLGVFYPSAAHDRLQERIATLKHGFDEWARAVFPVE